MELYNAKTFVVAKLKAYGLTVGKYYQVFDSHKHFENKCLTIIDDNNKRKSYNVCYFESE